MVENKKHDLVASMDFLGVENTKNFAKGILAISDAIDYFDKANCRELAEELKEKVVDILGSDNTQVVKGYKW